MQYFCNLNLNVRYCCWPSGMHVPQFFILWLMVFGKIRSFMVFRHHSFVLSCLVGQNTMQTKHNKLMNTCKVFYMYLLTESAQGLYEKISNRDLAI